MLVEKSFDTGELVLNYAESDSPGAPMVLLHGLTGGWQGWDPLIPELSKKWHIFALDLRGHGKSGRGAQYRIVDYARDVIAFLRSIDEPPVLVGHSTGALTALGTAAYASAGLRAVVLIDPPLCLRNLSMADTPGFQGWFAWVYDAVKDNPSYETVLARCRASIPPESGEAEVKKLADQIYGIAAGTVENVLHDEHLDALDLASALQHVECPTLLLQGDWTNGGAMRQEDADFVRANLPSARIIFIPNGSHLVQDQYAGITLQHMGAFLSSI